MSVLPVADTQFSLSSDVGPSVGNGALQCITWGPSFGHGDNGWYEKDACGGCKGRLLDGRFKAADTSTRAKGKDLKALAEEMKGKLAPKSSAAQGGQVFPAVPPAVPFGWEAHRDPASGRFFYVNQVTRQSQWEIPSGAVGTWAPPPARQAAAQGMGGLSLGGAQAGAGAVPAQGVANLSLDPAASAGGRRGINVDTLVAMGFDRQKAKHALDVSNNDLEQALMVLTSDTGGSGSGSLNVLAEVAGQAGDMQRVRNRWGDGLEAPAAGMRPFFPSGWTPTKTVGDAVKVFGQSDEEVQQLLTDAKRNAAKLKLLDISLSDKLVAAVLAYTKERPNLYADLNEACRTPGGHWERLLEHYRDYLYHLDRAVQALPNFSGETYRGIQTVGLGHAYREGATITWQQFSSASKVLLVAIQFLHLRVGSSAQLSGSLFVLQVEAGKQLELCSEFPSEKEVLLPLNSHFKVSKIIQDDAGKVQRLPLLGNYDVSGLVVYVLEQL